MKSRLKNSIFFISGIFFGILFVLNTISWLEVRDLSKHKFLEINFFDVGQGDAIFIETPQRHQILIDGGPSSAILEKIGKEMPFWDRTIDLIILSHPEKDHISGLIEILKRYKVENILWTGIIRDTSEYQEWAELIKKEGATITIAKAGQKIRLSKSNSQKVAYFDVLYPFEELTGQEFKNNKNSNDTSIVVKLVLRENSFLLTGDIPKSVEEKLIREYSCSNSCKFANLNSDVLKISHHGSKYSTDEYFLEKVLPEIAVIQVGKNSYGHPTNEVLERLKKFGIKVKRTDLDGDIKIISDGKNYGVSNFQN